MLKKQSHAVLRSREWATVARHLRSTSRQAVMLVAAIAALLCNAALAQPGMAPASLQVRLVVRDGHVRIDRAEVRLELDMHAANVYEQQCRIDRAAMAQELLDYLDALLQARGKLLTQLALHPAHPAAPELRDRRQRVEAAFDTLSKLDPEAESLWNGSGAWQTMNAPLQAWTSALRLRRPELMPGALTLSDLYLQIIREPAYADGPLLPDIDLDRDRSLAMQGIVRYRIAPPLVGVRGKIRPTANIAQWEALRSGLGDDVLAPFECRLWYRQPIVERLQDYVELRGLSLEAFRSARDARHALDLVPSGEVPRSRAGVSIERPRFEDHDAELDGDQAFGGRILLVPDPTLQAVYIGGADPAVVDRVLYLLLPTTDYAQVRRRRQDYLCTTPAFWMQDPRPPVVQLPLDSALGRQLQVAQAYMTRRTVAQRLQRLGAIGYAARIDYPEQINPPPGTPRAERLRQVRRVALLIAEPERGTADRPAASPAGSGHGSTALPACSTPRDAGSTPQEAPEPPLELTTDLARPQALRSEPPVVKPHRNHLELGVTTQAGKPPRWTGTYRRHGLGDDDSFAIELGQQGQGLGAATYSRDFVGFSRLGRRLQLTGRMYTDVDPERAVAADRPDERRSGAELRATLDLWRDRRQSFAQLELGLVRQRSELTGPSGSVLRTLGSLAEARLIWVRSEHGTQAAPHTEAVLLLARGRSEGDGFGKLGLEFNHHRFVGFFTQWDLRLRAAGVSGEVPVAEQLSFGGEDSVRGYRVDAAAGRRVWALQNELWTPLPWQPRSTAFAQTLRRQVAVAALLDVGGVHGSRSGFDGRKASIGIGLRYHHGDVLALRLDVARPVGSVGADDRRTRLHFSVSSQRQL